MTLNEYQKKAQSFDLTRGTPSHAHHALCQFLEEAGEVAGVYKRAFRGDGSFDHSKLVDELGDALWGLAALAAANNLTLGDVAAFNIQKLERRQAAGTIKGSGDR